MLAMFIVSWELIVGDLVGDGRRDVWQFEDDLSQVDLRGGYAVSVNEVKTKSKLARLEAGGKGNLFRLTHLQGSS